MRDEAANEHRAERISAVFALLTAKLEDAATTAAEGQSRHAVERLRGCEQIAELAGEASTIAAGLPLS